jgi:hypothetical protein
VETATDTPTEGYRNMNTRNIHLYFMASVLVLASGGFAMTAAILAGDYAAMDKLLNGYLYGYTGGIAALVGYAVHRRIRH